MCAVSVLDWNYICKNLALSDCFAVPCVSRQRQAPWCGDPDGRFCYASISMNTYKHHQWFHKACKHIKTTNGSNPYVFSHHNVQATVLNRPAPAPLAFRPVTLPVRRPGHAFQTTGWVTRKVVWWRIVPRDFSYENQHKVKMHVYIIFGDKVVWILGLFDVNADWLTWEVSRIGSSRWHQVLFVLAVLRLSCSPWGDCGTWEGLGSRSKLFRAEKMQPGPLILHCLSPKACVIWTFKRVCFAYCQRFWSQSVYSNLEPSACIESDETSICLDLDSILCRHVYAKKG